MAKPTVEVNKEKAIRHIEEYFQQTLGENAEPAAIDGDMMIRGSEDIYNSLMEGNRLLIIDPDDKDAYYAMEFDKRGTLVMQWISPEGGIRTNADNLNINAPDLPEYMTQEGQEEEIRQRSVVMVSETLRDYLARTYGEDGIAGAVDSDQKPIQDLDELAEKLSADEQVYVPVKGQEGLFYLLAFSNGELEVSKNPVPAGEYVSYDDRTTVPMEPDGIRPLLAENMIVSAQNADGELFFTREKIEEQLKKGTRLMLFDQGRRHAIVAEYFRGELKVTPRVERGVLDDENYNIDPGRLPENERILGFRIDDIDRLLTPDGEEIRDVAKIREALAKEGTRNYLFTKKDAEFPIAIENRGGTYFRSKTLYSEAEKKALSAGAFEELADQDLEGHYILDFRRDDLDYAADENGIKYDTPEKIVLALMKTDKSLEVYTKRDKERYEVERYNNRFYTSKEKLPSIGDIGNEYFLTNTLSMLKKRWLFGPGGGAEAKEFAFALDKEGHRYDSLEDVARKLDEDEGQKLFVFSKGGTLPYAVEKDRGQIYISDEVISAETKLPETHAFQPKKSLDMDDIIKRADKSEVFKAKDAVGDWKMLNMFYEKNLKSIEFVKKAGQPSVPTKPTKQPMGFWNSIGYGLTWLFTFGRGDTEAHREQTRLYDLSVKSYKENLEEFKKKQEAWKDYLENGEKKIAEYTEGIERSKKKMEESRKVYNEAGEKFFAASKDNDRYAVIAYQNNTEVLLEGVADLQEKGKITRSNVFANTWLRSAECDGKPVSDPEARKALIRFLASRSVEQQILKRADSEVVNPAHEERLVEQLNSGKAYEELEKDASLKAMLDEMGDKHINPDNIFSAYTKVLAEKSYASMGYKVRFPEIEKAIIDGFGEKKVDESCIDDLVRLFKFRQEMQKDMGTQLPYDEQSGKAQIKSMKHQVADVFRPISAADRERWREPVEALKGQGPMKLDEMLQKVLQKDREMVEAENAASEKEGPEL